MKTKRTIDWRKLLLELIVVFLGVTGGFVLNNWRDDYKNLKSEHKYMDSFVQNVDSNIVRLKEMILEDSIWLSSLRSNMLLMRDLKLPRDSNKVVIRQIVQVSKLILQNSTFEDMRYSGNLNIIRDYYLKEKIVSYHNSIEGSMYIDAYYNNYFQEFVMPFVINNYDLANDSFFDRGDKIQKQLFNITGGFHSLRYQRSENIRELLAESIQMKADLQEYINSNF
jgi:hypothetical protein